jgi:hypothetical protein
MDGITSNVSMTILDKLKYGASSGAAKGWSGYVWLLKILVPISLLTTLLETSGWLLKLDGLIAPTMHLLHLPSSAALPIVVGLLTGVYGAIASMMMLPFSIDQMTLIAIFILISHNLIQESMIQGQSGLSPVKAVLFRLTASLITIIIVAWFLDAASSDQIGVSVPVTPSLPLLTVITQWAISMTYLSIKIFFIVMILMIVMGILKSFDWIPVLVKILSPLLRLMGLNERVGMLWLTAVVFGLSYGAAVIVEEAKEGDLDARELERLHVSIGINHSMVEDPILFAALGLPVFWLWIPRMVIAIIAVHLYDGWERLSRLRKTGV